MAIAFDTSAAGFSVSATSHTQSISCSGSDRLLLVEVLTTNNAVPTGVTHAGNAMTQIGSTVLFNTNYRKSAWYIYAPTTGAQNIVASTGSSGNIFVAAASYTGVAQSGFPDNSGTNTGTGVSSLATSLTPNVVDTWVVLLASGSQPLNASTGTSRAESNGGYAFISDTNAAINPASSQTLTVTRDGGGTFNAETTIVSLAPATAASAPSAFTAGQWTVSDLATGGDARIAISALPSDGGSAITDLEYQLDAGTWTSLAGTTTGNYDISGLTDGVSTNVKIRAVNAIGNGPDSDTKSVTTTTAPVVIVKTDEVYVVDKSNTTNSSAGEYQAIALEDLPINKLFTYEKTFAAESPTGAEDFPHFLYTTEAITITQINAVLVGSSTPSVTWTIRHATDRSATGNEVVTGGTTTTSTTTGSEVTSFNDATIPANSYVWVETTAQSGTVDSLSITTRYTID